MGTITIRLKMPAVDFVEVRDVEIRFLEDGVLRTLNLDEWKAYFPGCGNPVVMRRIATGTEEVFQKSMPDKLIRMANAAHFLFAPADRASALEQRMAEAIHVLSLSPGDFQARYGVQATAEDAEPPTVWTLMQFLRECRGACLAFPQAAVEFHYARTEERWQTAINYDPNLSYTIRRT